MKDRQKEPIGWCLGGVEFAVTWVKLKAKSAEGPWKINEEPKKVQRKLIRKKKDNKCHFDDFDLIICQIILIL